MSTYNTLRRASGLAMFKGLFLAFEIASKHSHLKKLADDDQFQACSVLHAVSRHFTMLAATELMNFIYGDHCRKYKTHSAKLFMKSMIAIVNTTKSINPIHDLN